MKITEQKANDLIEKYYKLFSIDLENTISKYEAIHCAIICVEEIIKDTLCEYTNDENHDRIDFHKQVKQILENKLK